MADPATDVVEQVKPDLMARLAQHKTLKKSPVTEHVWLVAHGSLRTYAPGDVITAKGEQAKRLIVIFVGNLVMRADRGGGSPKIFEWRGGDVGGVVPYSRVTSPPHDVVAEEPTEALVIPREMLSEMIHECPVTTAELVHVMVDRAREFKSSDLGREKLISLGKLSAGLAPELNNPASAAVRSAKMLAESVSAAEDAARQIAAANLSESQLGSIETVRAICASSRAPTGLSTVARADREDAIAAWLADHDVSEEAAVALADTGVTLAALDALGGDVSGDELDAALRWIGASCGVRALSSEIETAASRIHDLVGAVKGFSYMDHAPAPEPVDIRKGIADTLTLLGAKKRAKSVEVSQDIPDNLPRAYAVGAELNQVWMNLIDNALDAVAVGGRIAVTAARELGCVVVQITDNGPGISPEIQKRIFEPFFTTKGVGEGTGLGLDIVRRLLQKHDGGVEVAESSPGRTVFEVRLPAEK